MTPVVVGDEGRDFLHFFDEKWDVAGVRRRPILAAEEAGFADSRVGKCESGEIYEEDDDEA